MTPDEAAKLKQLIRNYSAQECRAAESYADDKDALAARYGKRAEVLWDHVEAVITEHTKPDEGLMNTPHDRKVYLGDGAYARWDPEREALLLTAENGITATDMLVFEPEVLSVLLTYLKQQFPDADIWSKK